MKLALCVAASGACSSLGSMSAWGCAGVDMMQLGALEVLGRATPNWVDMRNTVRYRGHHKSRDACTKDVDCHETGQKVLRQDVAHAATWKQIHDKI